MIQISNSILFLLPPSLDTLSATSTACNLKDIEYEERFLTVDILKPY